MGSLNSRSFSATSRPSARTFPIEPPSAAALDHPAFCSVATRSHLASAVACLQSLHDFHGEADCWLLLIDPIADVPALPDWIGMLAAEDCIPAPVLLSMRSRYSAAELCFATKPFLLSHLIKAGYRQAHYLDGDCLAFHRLDSMIEALAGADLLLTPHALTPIPDDGLNPRPLTLLRGGVFNGGYIGVRNTSEGLRFLDWLSTMTERYGRNAPKEGMCGDQRWLDLAPVLYPGLAIFRNEGANVAYWNLHERRLAFKADGSGGLISNGEDLLFFHFSGYESCRAAELSRYQNRHSLEGEPPLQEAIDRYRSALRAQERLRPSAASRPRWRWW